MVDIHLRCTPKRYSSIRCLPSPLHFCCCVSSSGFPSVWDGCPRWRMTTVRSTWIAGLLPGFIVKSRDGGGSTLPVVVGVQIPSPSIAFHLFCRNMNCSVRRQATNAPMPASTMPQYREVVQLTVSASAGCHDCHELGSFMRAESVVGVGLIKRENKWNKGQSLAHRLSEPESQTLASPRERQRPATCHQKSLLRQQ